jgi:predicted secreted protein
MNISALIVVFVMVWWVVLFMVLPWGIWREQVPLQGNDPGAPAKSNMKLKLIVTTLIAVTVTALYVYLFTHGHLAFLKVRG